jgi:hypothetical protein
MQNRRTTGTVLCLILPVQRHNAYYGLGKPDKDRHYNVTLLGVRLASMLTNWVIRSYKMGRSLQ